MKIEMDSDSSWIAFFVVVFTFLATVILGGCHYTEATTQEAIKAGLVEKLDHPENPVDHSTHWDKP